MFLVPLILISGLSTILSAVLNADERFALGAATPVLIGLMPMLFVIAVGERWGILALSTGLIVGYACEFLVLSWTVYRRGFIAVPTLRSVHPETKQVVREYLPMVLGMVVMSATPLVDQAMAANARPRKRFGVDVRKQAGDGRPRHWSDGTLDGPLSPLLDDGRRRQLVVRPTHAPHVRAPNATRGRPARRGVLAVLGCAGASSVPAGSVLGGRHRSRRSVQALFALQIPFYVLGIIGVRLLSATGGNRLLMWISIGNFVTNIVGNYVFMQFWGVAGIAFSTSLVYVVSSGVIYSGVRRRINIHKGAQPT